MNVLLTGILRLHGSALTLLIKNGGVIVTKGSSDANANKSDNEIVQNSAAAKNQQNSNNDLGKKADTLRSESERRLGISSVFSLQ